MKQKIGLILTFIFLLGGLFTFVGCVDNVEPDDRPTISTAMLIGKSLTEQYVRYIGRVSYNEEEKRVELYHTASGFETKFYGTRLSVIFDCTNFDKVASRPYFQVFVDGEDDPTKGNVVKVDEANQLIVLASDLTEGYHTVKVLKRSEPQDSLTAIKQLKTDYTFVKVDVAPTYKVQLIGGSGISGHGSIGKDGQARTTSNSSSLHSFGYLVARMFDADFQFIANSGWGVKWGYNRTNNNGKVNLATAYNAVGILPNETLIGEYDNSQFEPNLIVVNAGGNDFTSHVSGAPDVVKATEEFKQAVADFLMSLRAAHPNVKIIWTYTDDTSGNGLASKEVIQSLDSGNLWVMPVVILGSRNGDLGANGHASFDTHIKDAQTIADVVTSWTGKLIVKQNVKSSI